MTSLKVNIVRSGHDSLLGEALRLQRPAQLQSGGHVGLVRIGAVDSVAERLRTHDHDRAWRFARLNDGIHDDDPVIVQHYLYEVQAAGAGLLEIHARDAHLLQLLQYPYADGIIAHDRASDP